MSTVRGFVRVAMTDVAYNETLKAAFHSKGRAVLRQVAKVLGLQPGTYDIRSNLGGIAVSGEVTLHAENVYIQLAQGSLGSRFMYRHCNGRKDYTGGVNRWMDFSTLLDLDRACDAFRQAMQGA